MTSRWVEMTCRCIGMTSRSIGASMFLYGFEGCCGFFAAFHEDVGDAGEEEDGEDEGVEGGGVVAFLDEPPVVDDAGDGGDVDEAVETLPVFSAHGAEDEGW